MPISAGSATASRMADRHMQMLFFSLCAKEPPRLFFHRDARAIVRRGGGKYTFCDALAAAACWNGSARLVGTDRGGLCTFLPEEASLAVYCLSVGFFIFRMVVFARRSEMEVGSEGMLLEMVLESVVYRYIV